MKQTLILPLVLLLMVAFGGCHSGQTERTKPQTDTITPPHHGGERIAVFIMDTLTGDTDTVYVDPKEKVVRLPVDREEKAKREAAEQERRLREAHKGKPTASQGPHGQTADQSLFDVRGPVASLNYAQGFTASYNQIVYIPEQRDIVTFTRDGRWVPSSRYTVRRDRQGRVVQLTRKADNIVNEFTYTGRLIKEVKVYAAAKKNVYSTAHIERDPSGLVSGYTADIVFPGDNGRQRVRVKILARDRYGNWTRRRFTTQQESRIEERVIEYRK